MKLSKELIKEIVKEQKFTSTNQIMETIKEMFSDILEEVLQCENDEQLGYKNTSVGEMDLTITETVQQNGN